MAASYPSSLPVKDAAGANLSSNPHSTLHDAMYDEIVAIATELGTNPKGTAASVKARLDLVNVGAWTSYTPQIDQGASNLPHTVNYSKYVRNGRTITWNFTITTTNATASAPARVELVLPVTAASVYVLSGNGLILDASAQDNYPVALSGISTTRIACVYTTDGTNTAWGVTPEIALAANDAVSGSITYEAAS